MSVIFCLNKCQLHEACARARARVRARARARACACAKDRVVVKKLTFLV